MITPPLISIITPSLNRADMIGTAIESVLNQGYPHFEHIIVDGGSRDGTLDLLKKYTHLRLLSGKDKGVYDALNKGIASAHGDIIGQLNTDDYYESGVFSSIGKIFIEDNHLDAVSAGADVYELQPDGRKKVLASYPGISQSELLHRATIGVPVFNGWFFRKSLFEKVGSYSLNYPTAADRDFLIRCALGSIPYRSLDAVIYHYRQHPGSLTITDSRERRVKYIHEAFDIANSYLKQPAPSEQRTIFTDWLAYLCGELLVAGIVLRKASLIGDALRRARALSLPWFFKFLTIRRKQQAFASRKKQYENQCCNSCISGG
jgi:glycosyltransferase involved in cell wall biosynthesis